MQLSKSVEIKAIEGIVLLENPSLWEDNGRPTEEHRKAIILVYKNLDDFRRLILEELNLYPNVNLFFRQLIQKRLNQDKPLSSPIIQSLFPSGPIDLEDRLCRIAHIPNIDAVSKNIRIPKAFEKGFETDEIIKDIWTEFFVADFLISTLKVNYVEKVIRGKSQFAVEFFVQTDNEDWIVEVTRLRRRDFQGETMPWGSEDCTRPENISQIQKALRLKLFDKNQQIQKFIKAENSDFDKRIVAIKTSQEEYQDCSQIIAEQATKLTNEKSYPEITHVLLIYDISTYDLIENVRRR